jgi:hypothetical protein
MELPGKENLSVTESHFKRALFFLSKMKPTRFEHVVLLVTKMVAFYKRERLFDKARELLRDTDQCIMSMNDLQRAYLVDARYGLQLEKKDFVNALELALYLKNGLAAVVEDLNTPRQKKILHEAVAQMFSMSGSLDDAAVLATSFNFEISFLNDVGRLYVWNQYAKFLLKTALASVLIIGQFGQGKIGAKRLGKILFPCSADAHHGPVPEEKSTEQEAAMTATAFVSLLQAESRERVQQVLRDSLLATGEDACQKATECLLQTFTYSSGLIDGVGELPRHEARDQVTVAQSLLFLRDCLRYSLKLLITCRHFYKRVASLDQKRKAAFGAADERMRKSEAIGKAAIYAFPDEEERDQFIESVKGILHNKQ